MAPTVEQEREYIAQLETLSDAQIRSDIDHGRIPPAYVHAATTYLSQRERASASEKMEIERRGADAAERQATAAERANKKANSAIVISIVSVAVAIVSVAVAIFVHH